MTDKPLHIVELRAENVKRLQAVTVRPDGATVVIGGRNAQGKSSLLDSIEMALGGGKSIPVEPVRRGERSAKIVLDLGEIVVERTFSPKGTALEVRNAEGVPQKSPQVLLDSLTAKVCFDPLEFARDDPKRQDATLKRVLGLDFSELDSRRAKLYVERRDVNRDIKTLEARQGSASLHTGVPAAPVSVAELTAELERLRDIADENRNRRERAENRRDELERHRGTVRQYRDRIGSLERELEVARCELASLEESERAAAANVAAESEQLTALVDPDTSAVRSQIANAEETNAKIRANKARRELDKELLAATQRADRIGDEIADIDEQKKEALSAAKFPVPGLGFDETGPTLNGFPLAQASQAERLRVSVAIGAALNPRVRVMLLREASALDEDGLALLAELARETDSQLWIERVGSRDESAIIIEDGLVLPDFDQNREG